MYSDFVHSHWWASPAAHILIIAALDKYDWGESNANSIGCGDL